MGLLGPDYFQNKATQPAPTPAPVLPSQGAPAAAPESLLGNMQAAEGKVLNPIEGVQAQENAAQKVTMTPDEQIKKYGGLIGSPQYYDTLSKNKIGLFGRGLAEAVGMKLPPPEVWDGMSFADKALSTSNAAATAAIGLAVRTPRQVVEAPTRFALSTAETVSSPFRGGRGFEKPVQLPWLGSVPTYTQSAEEFRKAGYGPLAATLMTGNQAVGDVLIGSDLAEAATKAFQPRMQADGRPILDTKPIESVLQREQGKMALVRKPADSLNEYYTLPKSVAEKHGGNPSNTFLKLTPSGVDGGTTELSIVQTRRGFLDKASDFIRGRGEKVYKGDFGPEIKLSSQELPSSVKTPLTSEIGQAERTKIMQSVLPKPLKGFADKPIDATQLDHLGKISQANGITPELADTVVNALTGKKAAGELTQAEYVQVSQALAKMDKMSMLTDVPRVSNAASRWLSPQRRWMARTEELSGGAHPIYSEGYVPLENAMQAKKVFFNQHFNEVRDIFGKYVDAKYAPERRLVKAYMEGDTGAIAGNDAIDAATKKDLVDISTKLRAKYDELGPLFGIETDKFLKNYQPHLANIGGIFQLYKDGKGIPKEMSFFAEKHRVGSTNVQVDDAMALADIYLNAGSNTKFLNPALERINGMGSALPETLQKPFKNYVQEKLGYADALEKHLNNMVPALNKMYGWNLPPDLARQMTHVIMDTTHSGALGLRPDAVIRNLFQVPLLTGARLGWKFRGEAVAKALTAEGRQAVIDSGLAVKLGVPYGEELTKEITPAGRLQSGYSKATQASLRGYASADLFGRAATYWQGKFIWDDALARYKSGATDYAGLEKNLDLNAMSAPDRNVIRKALIAGDEAGAFNHYVRDIIDETQFPFRKAASAQATYGLTGKLFTQFGQWNIEFSHTLGRWARTGQWDKLARFGAASYGLQRTMKDALGLDVTKWTGLNPISPTLAPFVQFGSNMNALVADFKNNNRQAMDQDWKQVVRAFKSLGVPAGVELGRAKDFSKSIAKGPIGPNGTFPVYNSSSGKLDHWSDFTDLWWDTLWGFPSAKNQATKQTVSEMRNATEEYNQAKQKALQLYQNGQNDEANALVRKYGISISPGDQKAFNVPLDQGVFSTLPASQKNRFAPRVFPQP